MKFNHCTIDLETMGNLPTSAITAIGVVMFDLEDNRREFEVNVSLQSSMDKGMTVQGDTIMWWMNQSKDAQNALTDPKPVDLDIALRMVDQFIRAHRAKSFTCWTHATFDAPIINYALNLCDIKPAIHYREHRDIRTLTWLNRNSGPKATMPAQLTAHRALDDARYQADYISAHLIRMGVGQKQTMPIETNPCLEIPLPENT